jgi:rod shape-determining protein MreB
MTAVFTPSRVFLVETVRAAAIGAGAAAGVLLVLDVGSQLTEVALLVDGRVAAARRADLGTDDGSPGGVPRMIAAVAGRLIADIGSDARTRRLTAAALARGVTVVGDGATIPELIARLERNLRAPVRPVLSPRLVALSGAGRAAAAAGRHPATATIQTIGNGAQGSGGRVAERVASHHGKDQ